MKTQTVLAIGAHIGDAELTAGALLASCAVHGGKAVTLALTAGEKGAPAGADIAEYRRGKIAEAEAFAKELENSMHKDHIVCHRIVVDAWFYAAIEGFQRELPKHFAKKLYFAENWEDAPGFEPYVYVDVSDGYALWEKAIDHHWFAVHSTSFPYKEYYSHLKRLRGIQGRKGYCECFMIPKEQYKLVQTLEDL